MIEIKHKTTGEVLRAVRGITLRGANLRGANLGEADLRGANLSGADLRGANLSGAKMFTNYNLASLFGVVLMEQEVRGE